MAKVDLHAGDICALHEDEEGVALGPHLDPGAKATNGQMDDFFSQLPYKCRLKEVEYMGV